MSFLPRTIGDSIALRDTIAAGTMAGCVLSLGRAAQCSKKARSLITSSVDIYFSGKYILDGLNQWRKMNSSTVKSFTAEIGPVKPVHYVHVQIVQGRISFDAEKQTSAKMSK